MSDRIDIRYLKVDAEAVDVPGLGTLELPVETVLALVEAVEAAHRRQSVRGPLGETIRERAAAEQALDDALARFDFGEET